MNHQFPLALPDALPTTTAPPAKKPRKPYTITKQREVWTEEEHKLFLDALKLYDRDWKKIQQHIQTKTVIQIRSHAQKHFIKVKKNKTGEHIPPPRPKRKASRSPAGSRRKAQRTDLVSSPWGQVMPVGMFGPAAFRHYLSNSNPAYYPPLPLEGARLQSMQLNRAQQHLNRSIAGSQARSFASPATEAPLPDFAKIYEFLANVFDQNATDHFQRLQQMDPADRDTLQLLMNNLAVNLSSPAFRNHHASLMEQYRQCYQDPAAQSAHSHTPAPTPADSLPLSPFLSIADLVVPPHHSQLNPQVDADGKVFGSAPNFLS